MLQTLYWISRRSDYDTPTLSILWWGVLAVGLAVGLAMVIVLCTKWGTLTRKQRVLCLALLLAA